MKQSVFNYFSIRLRILRINIANTFNVETAYPAENWANLLSTVMFTATYLLFLNIIFSNVNSLAGYSKNDMLFFTFVSQIAFYTLYNWSYDNMEGLIDSVRMGKLDILLTKPLPTLFYISTRQLSLIRLVRDAFLPMTMIALLIDWHAINITLLPLLAGIIIFICGQWAAHVIQFLLSVAVFWSGQSQALLSVAYTLSSPDIPLEGLAKAWRITLTTILPISLPVAGSVSVMLDKGNPISLLILALIIAIIATTIRQKIWVKALNIYNSASS